MSKDGIKKWIKFVVRWGIAVVGIWIVVSNIYIRDTVNLLDDNNVPYKNPVPVVVPATDESPTYTVIHPITGKQEVVPRERTINVRDRKTVDLQIDGGSKTVPMLGLHLSGNLRSANVDEILVDADNDGKGEWVSPSRVVGGSYHVQIPRPRLIVGLGNMARRAWENHAGFLVLAVFIFPITYMVTAVRWKALLTALEVSVPLSRVFALNMVGSFYNTFMPGSTGGDVLKAYYASKQTPHKMRAAMSVLIDRVLGLITLVAMGGSMAAYQYAMAKYQQAHTGEYDSASRAYLQVAIGSVVILAGGVFSLWVFYNKPLRKWIGLEALLHKLPMQRHVWAVVDVMRIYKQRPTLVFWALVVTFPVHLTVCISAMLCGMAFGLPITWAYYFVAVPVIVLSGSIPISPQGAGVMEYFAIKLTEKQGATVAHALALTLSIRMVQILWNLSGGIFVLKGGYHAPTAAENADLEQALNTDIDAPAREAEADSSRPDDDAPPFTAEPTKA